MKLANLLATIAILTTIAHTMISSVAAQPELQEAFAAAVRLKEAKVILEFERCQIDGASESFCRSAVAAVGEREERATFRIFAAMASLPINEIRLTQEYLACTDSLLTYSISVWCVEQLLERIIAAGKGQFLVIP